MSRQNPHCPEPSGVWVKMVTEKFEETMLDERQAELRKYHQERIDQKKKMVEDFNQKSIEGEISLLEKIKSSEEARREGFKKFLRNDIGLRFDVEESSQTIVSASIATLLTETVSEREETLAVVTSRLSPEISSMAVKTGKPMPPVPPPKPAALAATVRYPVTREKAVIPLFSPSTPKDEVCSSSMALAAATISHTRPSVSNIVEVVPLSASEQQSDVKMVREAIAKRVGSYVYCGEMFLGLGRQARVYRCLNLSDNKAYAIREIPMTSSDQHDHKKITSEVALMKKLDHPNAIKLHDAMFCSEMSTWYMVLELCESELLKLDREGKTLSVFSELDCRHYFQQLLLGMEYVHKHGIVHRDIKPGNLLINNGMLKIADFGSSRMFEKDQDMLYMSRHGTVAYMAPELSNRRCQHDGKLADIWSMGVTLFLMWNGELPFTTMSATGTKQVDYQSRAGLKLETPEPLKTLLDKLLEMDPTKRITMDELRNDPWVINNGDTPLARSKVENEGGDIIVTEEDKTMAVQSTQVLAGVVKAAGKLMVSLSKIRGRALAASMLEIESAGAASEPEVNLRCETVVSSNLD